MAQIEDFNKLDIRVGTIISVKDNIKAKKPAYILEIDFGKEIGIKISSAQITNIYSKESLINKQVVAITNFPSRQIADIKSEVLVLGTYSKDGVVLLTPDRQIENGDKIG